jgi:uncharacterized protein
MKYAGWGLLGCLLPAGAMAATLLGGWMQTEQCFDVQLYLKLLLWGPLVEECVFRAGLQDLLVRRWGWATLANACTSAVFALAHYAVSGNPASLLVAAPSLVLGWVYQRTQTLVWVVGLHIFFNGIYLAWAC